LGKVWQQLLALALLARDRQAAQMLAAEGLRQQQTQQEQWLPNMMQLAIGGSRAWGLPAQAGGGHSSFDALAAAHQSFAGSFSAAGLHPLLPTLQHSMLRQQHLPADTNQGLQQMQQLQQLSWRSWQLQGEGPQQVTQPQQQSVQQQQQQWLQPHALGLQQMLQLQGQEQQVFTEQCLQQVAGLMAAATCGTGATTIMAGWAAAGMHAQAAHQLSWLLSCSCCAPRQTQMQCSCWQQP
jgi:hypothetical protein